MSERRYDDDEVRRIFEAATEPDAAVGPRGRASSGEGLTLAELKEIGAEVGIPERLVERAAAALDQPSTGAVPTRGSPVGALDEVRMRRAFGVPFGVDREQALPRMLSDDEWNQLVMESRRTFSARGRLEEVGSLREWRNGNLYVALAPAGDGAILTMGTRKGDARPLAVMGTGLMAIATVLLVVMALVGGVDAETPVILGGMGLALLGGNVLRLPAWAKERARQMDRLAERAAAMAGRSAGPPGITSGPTASPESPDGDPPDERG